MAGWQPLISFLPQVEEVAPTARRRPIAVHILSAKGTYHAQLHIGGIGFTLKVDSRREDNIGGEPAATARVHQFTMVPSAAVDGSCRREGILCVTGAWPTYGARLKFGTQQEAGYVERRLQSTAFTVVQSLHTRAPLGAPSLLLRPRPWQQQQHQPSDRGPLLMGGYVVVGGTLNPGDPDLACAGADELGDGLHFCLVWAELCGPNAGAGAVGFYAYLSHGPGAMFVGFRALAPTSNVELVGNIVRFKGAEEGASRAASDFFAAFRDADEAPERGARAARRAAAVAADLIRREAAGLLPAAPLLVDDTRVQAQPPSRVGPPAEEEGAAAAAAAESREETGESQWEFPSVEEGASSPQAWGAAVVSDYI